MKPDMTDQISSSPSLEKPTSQSEGTVSVHDIPSAAIEKAAEVCADSDSHASGLFPTFSHLTGGRSLSEAENLQETGSFKLRGPASKFMSCARRIGPEARGRGLGRRSCSGGCPRRKARAGFKAPLSCPSWLPLQAGGDPNLWGRGAAFRAQSRRVPPAGRHLARAGKGFRPPLR